MKLYKIPLEELHLEELHVRYVPNTLLPVLKFWQRPKPEHTLPLPYQRPLHNQSTDIQAHKVDQLIPKPLILEAFQNFHHLNQPYLEQSIEFPL